jgi:hypothetical protein
MQCTVETEQEVDGRWIGEVIEIPGVMKYGMSQWPSTRAFSL